MTLYFTVKYLHVLGATVILGTGTGIAFFMPMAHRSRDPAFIALTVLSHLPGWAWVRVLRLVPKPLRDAVYNLVARNRFRIFGKYETCFVPDAELRARVIE
jgi:predicted DCC family thiol-disulfide oxidoreductase YuxK